MQSGPGLDADGQTSQGRSGDRIGSMQDGCSRPTAWCRPPPAAQPASRRADAAGAPLIRQHEALGLRVRQDLRRDEFVLLLRVRREGRSVIAKEETDRALDRHARRRSRSGRDRRNRNGLLPRTKSLPPRRDDLGSSHEVRLVLTRLKPPFELALYWRSKTRTPYWSCLTAGDGTARVRHRHAGGGPQQGRQRDAHRLGR